MQYRQSFVKRYYYNSNTNLLLNISPFLIMVLLINIISYWNVLGDAPLYLYVILKGSAVVLEKSLSSSSLSYIPNSVTPTSNIDQSSSKSSEKKSLLRMRPNVIQKDYSENESLTILKSLPDLCNTEVYTSKINYKRSILNRIISKESPRAESSLNDNNDDNYNNQILLDSFNKAHFESATSPMYQKIQNFNIKEGLNILPPDMKIKYKLSYGNYFGEIVSNNGIKKLKSFF